MPSPAGPADAVLAFTAHHVLAADVEPAWVTATLPSGDLGAAMNAEFLTGLARRLGTQPGTLDIVVAALAAPDDSLADLEATDEDFEHPRLARAVAYRRDVRAFRDGHGGVITVGYGLAGRVEVSIEIDESARGAGLGTTLARQALALGDPGVPVFAQVAPGNVASLCCFLAAGYRPIGAEVLFHRPSR